MLVHSMNPSKLNSNCRSSPAQDRIKFQKTLKFAWECRALCLFFYLFSYLSEREYIYKNNFEPWWIILHEIIYKNIKFISLSVVGAEWEYIMNIYK